jgi:hypothetical protein
MSPTREDRRSTDRDAAKLTLPLPMTIGATVGAIVFALSIGGAVWSIKTDVQLMAMRMEYEAKLRAADKEMFNIGIKALEAKIDAASNRAAALSAMQELTKSQTQQLRGR